jgi:hypothetical protein
MKYKEIELARTEYFRHIRIQQSVKFNANLRDYFNDEKAAEKEIQLSKIKCPFVPAPKNPVDAT